LLGQPLDQQTVEVILEIFDVAANGRLREMHRMGGLGKAFQLNDFTENLKLP
jgi:hypothetical protein